MKVRTFLFSMLIVLLVTTPAVAQEGSTDHVAAIKQSLQTSMKTLHGYSWVETTAVSLKGDEKSRTQASCAYGADGKVQKTPMGEPAQPKKKRGLRGKIVEKKKGEITDAMHEAIDLVKQYVPPDPEKIQAAKEAGNLSLMPPDDTGNLKVVIKNYLKEGDSLTLAANAATNRILGMSVSSFTDKAKDAVDLKVTFGALNDGTVYQKTTDLEVASEKVEVTITNSDYKKLGG